MHRTRTARTRGKVEGSLFRGLESTQRVAVKEEIVTRCELPGEGESEEEAIIDAWMESSVTENGMVDGQGGGGVRSPEGNTVCSRVRGSF